MSSLSKCLSVLGLHFSLHPEGSRVGTTSIGTEELSWGESCRHCEAALAMAGLLSWMGALQLCDRDIKWPTDRQGKHGSVDVRMIFHSPGRTKFNTLHKVLQENAYNLLSSRIFQWLSPDSGWWSDRHTGLARWHGHRYPHKCLKTKWVCKSSSSAPFQVLLVT